MLSEKFHNRGKDEAMFMTVFNATLPHMTNTQIVSLFNRLIVTSDDAFGFIHQQHHDFFDRLRLGIFHLKLHLAVPLWQTANFCDVAYRLGNQFVKNLESGEKITPHWEKDTELHSFIHFNVGNFFHTKSKEREDKILAAITLSLSEEHVLNSVNINP